MHSPAEAAPSIVLVPELPASGARFALPENESHYLTRVCRAREGDRASATDGRGALATVRLVSRDHPAMVEVETITHTRRTRSAWVMAGAPDGDRGDWMVEKLAELGVAVFQPVECERGAWQRMGSRTERWGRLAVAALRQSRRPFLLEIRPPVPLAQALEQLPEEEPGKAGRWIADAGGERGSHFAPSAGGTAVGLIGPPAGFTALERSAATDKSFAPISLSNGRLRTETAALAWACWWAAGDSNDALGG
jgi:16S rRNA (uracil1498-N3)-methyltransferase